MFERFDEPARRALFFARYDASRFGHAAIEPAHLATGALRSLDDVRLATLMERLTQASGWTATEPPPLQAEIPFDVPTKQALTMAASLADQRGHRWIQVHHLLAAVMRIEGTPVTALLRDLGMDPDALLDGLSGGADAGDETVVVSGAGRERIVGHIHVGDNAADVGADEHRIRAAADALFIATDQKDWLAARLLFADGPIDVDMTSVAGGVPLRMTADDLIAGFRAALHAGKASHHLVANYRVTVDRSANRAYLFGHGYAWNRVAALPAGEDLWETWGTYRLTFTRIDSHWGIDGFRYDSKLTRGNDAVRTHVAAG